MLHQSVFSHCPDGLTELIARETANDMLKKDLTPYRAPDTPNLEEGDSFCGDENETQNSEKSDDSGKPKQPLRKSHDREQISK